MLQPCAFCEHTLQQNATAAGAPLRPAPDPAGGAYSAPPDLLAGFKGATSRQGGEGGKERDRRRREREKKGREGGEGERRVG